MKTQMEDVKATHKVIWIDTATRQYCWYDDVLIVSMKHPLFDNVNINGIHIYANRKC